MTVLYDRWLGQRKVSHLGTNHLAAPIAFSDWYRFKEAFSPEFVAEAINSHPREVNMCFDPFSGSGTTAITSQMLQTPSVSVEVNPFLCDLARAKVCNYNLHELELAFIKFLEATAEHQYGVSTNIFDCMPKTFLEPGHQDRWIFSHELARVIQSAVDAAKAEPVRDISRFLKVVVGSCLVPTSNVVINGKGRRYRKNWLYAQKSSIEFFELLQSNGRKALMDISRFQDKANTAASVVLGDCRGAKINIPKFDVAVFSPPYPNSFDYTDVYNVELWVLGYLTSSKDNQLLRQSTLSSHVQMTRKFKGKPAGSPLLDVTLEMLIAKRAQLWNKNIPEMIGAYFAEMNELLVRLQLQKKAGGRIWLVVGNSQYGEVEVRSGDIIAELSHVLGLKVLRNDDSRFMRNSPQQGGFHKLSEKILVLE